ncbi:MAG: hypothetical protein ACRDS0_16180 [Pseudonocardiaceae bacterium]
MPGPESVDFRPDLNRARRQPKPPRPHNLWEPVDGPDGHDHGAHGIFDGKAHNRAPQLWFSHHARLVSTAAAVTGLGAAAVTWLRRR